MLSEKTACRPPQGRQQPLLSDREHFGGKECTGRRTCQPSEGERVISRRLPVTESALTVRGVPRQQLVDLSGGRGGEGHDRRKSFVAE